jgi:hypothetical protein
MLSYEQKFYLIKKIDKYALSSKRKELLPIFFGKYPYKYSDADYKQISDMLYLSEESVRDAMKKASR